MRFQDRWKIISIIGENHSSILATSLLMHEALPFEIASMRGVHLDYILHLKKLADETIYKESIDLAYVCSLPLHVSNVQAFLFDLLQEHLHLLVDNISNIVMILTWPAPPLATAQCRGVPPVMPELSGLCIVQLHDN